MIFVGPNDYVGEPRETNDPFWALHPIAAICGYIELWARGERNIRNAIAIREALLKSAYKTSPSTNINNFVRSWNGEQLPSPEDIYHYSCQIGLLRQRSSRIEIVNFAPSLLKILRDNPQDLAQLTPQQFEHLIADRLDRMGFDVVLTGAVQTRDGGIDLVATPKQRGLASFLLATQVKHHRTNRPTSREDVDRLLAWKDSVFRMGLIVTNSRFTQDAKWIAAKNSHFIRLRDFFDIARWLDDNFSDSQDWSELPSSIELAPGIITKIPPPRLPPTVYRKRHKN